MHTFSCLRWKCPGNVVNTIGLPCIRRFWGCLLRHTSEADVLPVLCCSLNLTDRWRGRHWKRTKLLLTMLQNLLFILLLNGTYKCSCSQRTDTLSMIHSHLEPKGKWWQLLFLHRHLGSWHYIGNGGCPARSPLTIVVYSLVCWCQPPK